MIPLQLTLKNFLSYRDETSIDFTNVRIACLSGDNGAGKSALLDAITWALWGKTRASSDRDVVSLGALEMEVTFAFRLGEREYRIFRRRSVSGAGRHTIELDVRAPGDDGWTSITGDSVRHSQEKINHLLCMEYETFVHSAFILQGKADAFTEKPPAERKKILGDILNLQEYDALNRMARDEERAIRESLAGIQGQMGELDEQLVGRVQVVDELEVTMIKLTDLGQRLDLAQQLAQTLKLQLHQYEAIQRQVDEAARRAAREEEALAGVRQRLVEQQETRDRLVAALEDAADTERGWAELEHWRAEVGRLAAMGRDDQAQQQIAHDAQREIDAERSGLERAAEGHRQTALAARQSLERLARHAERLAGVRAELDEAGDVASRLAGLTSELEGLRQEYSRLDAENIQLRAQMDEIKANMALLDRDDADCPTCRRPLSEHDRRHVHESWTCDGRALGDRFRSNADGMRQLKQRAEALKAEQARLELADRENAGRRAVIDQLAGQLAERPAVEDRLARAERDLHAVEQLVAGGAYAHDARARLDAAVAARRAIGYDIEAARAAATMEREYTPFAERKARLDEARAGASQAEALIHVLEEQVGDRERAHAETLQTLETMRRENPPDPALRERCLAAEDELDRLNREKSALLNEQGQLEGRIRELDRLQERRDDLDKQAATLALNHGATKALVDAFGRNGIQAMIVEGVLPELEDEANRMLRQMSTGQLEVSFRSQRQAQSRDSIIETLDIIIRDEAGERPYALYSGGEAFRVNFAVRVALSKLLARRAGASIDMLVIDEGFGTQDSRGRDGLIEALRSIEGDFQTILVITHIGEIRELFPTRIDVVKTERGSQVTVS